MKRLSTITVLSAITLFMFSCGSLSISQKRYSNGVNIAFNNKADEMNTLLEKAKRENTKSEKRIAELNSQLKPTSIEQVSAPQIAQIPTFATTLNKVSPVTSNPLQEQAIAAAITKQTQPIMQESTVKLNTLQKLAIKKATKQIAKKGAKEETDKILLVLLALILPPLAVYLYEGSWTKRCTINLILTLLCGIPGVIHALIVVLS